MRTSMEKLNVECIDGKVAVMKLFKEGNNKMRAQKQAALPIKGKTQMNDEALLERHKRISSGMCVQTNRIKNFPVPVVYICRAGFIKNGNRLQSKRKISILFFPIISKVRKRPLEKAMFCCLCSALSLLFSY